jgi:hypothetical protein
MGNPSFPHNGGCGRSSIAIDRMWALTSFPRKTPPTMNHPTGITAKKARHVSMHESARIKFVLHLNEYTDEEFDACYYSRDEIAEI